MYEDYPYFDLNFVCGKSIPSFSFVASVGSFFSQSMELNCKQMWKFKWCSWALKFATLAKHSAMGMSLFVMKISHELPEIMPGQAPGIALPWTYNLSSGLQQMLELAQPHFALGVVFELSLLDLLMNSSSSAFKPRGCSKRSAMCVINLLELQNPTEFATRTWADCRSNT